MDSTQYSLPGVKSISTVDLDKIAIRHLDFISMSGQVPTLMTHIEPVTFVGSPKCTCEVTYKNKQRVESAKLEFATIEPLAQHGNIGFVVRDMRGDDWLIGLPEEPRPDVKVTRNFGNPSGDAALTTHEVTFASLKALIKIKVLPK